MVTLMMASARKHAHAPVRSLPLHLWAHPLRYLRLHPRSRKAPLAKIRTHSAFFPSSGKISGTTRSSLDSPLVEGYSWLVQDGHHEVDIQGGPLTRSALLPSNWLLCRSIKSTAPRRASEHLDICRTGQSQAQRARLHFLTLKRYEPHPFVRKYIESAKSQSTRRIPPSLQPPNTSPQRPRRHSYSPQWSSS